MISYQNLARSQTFWARLGYKPIELPWVASLEAQALTLPLGVTPTKCDLGLLVGSAEQSFLDQVFFRGTLPPGKYQAITPCFRDEPEDEFHMKYFMKNELFVTGEGVGSGELDLLVGHALTMFGRFGLFGLTTTVIQTSFCSFDIISDGIELGSYGIRTSSVGRWLYGTGCAEPRTSQVLARLRG
jgi:hypothetical protein